MKTRLVLRMMGLALILTAALYAATGCATTPTTPKEKPVPPAALRLAPNCVSVWQVQLDGKLVGETGIYFFRGADTLTVTNLAAGDHQLYASQLDPSSGWSLGHVDETVTMPGVGTMLCASYTAPPAKP